MPFSPITIDESVTRTGGGGGFVHVPDGDYLMTVSSNRVSPENYAGKPYIQWGLRIKQGRGGIGRTLNYTTSFTPDSMFGLGNLFLHCGQDPNKLKGRTISTYDEFKATAAALLRIINGKDIGATLATKLNTDRNGKQVESSDIVALFPAAEWAERSAALAAAPTATTPPATPSPTPSPTASTAPSPTAPPPEPAADAVLADIEKMFGTS